MNSAEIRLFVHTLTYDLETISYLQDYNRMKETIPIVENVFLNIENFRHQSNEGVNEIKDVFNECFWKDKFTKNESLSDIVRKLKEIAREPRQLQEESLNQIEYTRLIEELNSWVYLNRSILKKHMKSPEQKKMEIILSFILGSVVGLCLLLFVIFKFLHQDWGLEGRLYKGMNFEELMSKKIYGTIDFSTDKPNSSVQWNGHINIPQDGVYTFYVITDDGARLYLDGKIVIDHWEDSRTEEFKGTLSLNKGQHSIRMEYFNHIGTGTLRLFWDFEKHKKEIIPYKVLRHSK